METTYWSSCCCRIIIALNVKFLLSFHFAGLEYQYILVNLLKGEKFNPEFQKLNPIGYVLVLVDGDIIISDYCNFHEEKYPQHPLLPSDLVKKALNFQAANIVCFSIQPLQNQVVLEYIEEKVSPDEKIPWTKVHIEKGFEALKKLLKDHARRYATGDKVYMVNL
ncbi:hypothetical protein V6Z11_D10G089900 [Gossypium hirsutum]